MAARCKACGYHLEHGECLVCELEKARRERDALEARLASWDEKWEKKFAACHVAETRAERLTVAGRALVSTIPGEWDVIVDGQLFHDLETALAADEPSGAAERERDKAIALAKIMQRDHDALQALRDANLFDRDMVHLSHDGYSFVVRNRYGLSIRDDPAEAILGAAERAKDYAANAALAAEERAKGMSK